MTAAAQKRPEARRERLLKLLADGEFHSGEVLARRLRMSRGGVWKLVRALRALGVDISSVPRRGYRLPRAVDLYDKDVIRRSISAGTCAVLERLDVLLAVDSTNRYVGELPVPGAGHGCGCVAEVQIQGRGRRGRTWVAPFGSGICLSLGWQFAEVPPAFPALSLAVGVAAVRALHRFGADSVGVKWPNDLVWRNRKLGGILIEMRGEATGPAHVVIGIGLNTRMPATARLALAEQQAALVADLHEILRERMPPRSALAGALLEEVIAVLQDFAERGFEPFAQEWRRLDSLAGASVKVITGAQTVFGTAHGVADDGTLLIDVNGQTQRFVSGEVSLRALSP